MSNLATIQDNQLTLNFHAGQWWTWEANTRWVCMLAGTQGGKTSFGPYWLYREINTHGAGDYLAVSATYDLFRLKMLPELLEVYEGILGIGRYWAGDKIIEIANPHTGQFTAKRSTDRMYARIILRSANAIGGLESATAKGSWLDECGQDRFSLEAFFAIRRRLSLYLARCLMTTTLYNLGWLVQNFLAPAELHARPEYLTLPNGAEVSRIISPPTQTTVIQFDSIASPAFATQEYLEAQNTLPAHLFLLFYRGRSAQPPGLIYDCFQPQTNTFTPFTIPAEWPRYIGLDFGGVNTCALVAAADPAGNLYVYAEYLHGQRTAKEHTQAITTLAQTQALPIAVGGAKSEGQWRKEFASAGLPVAEPKISEVELGILKVYGRLKTHQLKISTDCVGLLDEIGRYRRELDPKGQPTQTIKDKETFHRLDALRYLCVHLSQAAGQSNLIPPPPPPPTKHHKTKWN